MPKGFTFPKQSGAQKQRVGGYVVAAKGQTFVIHKAPEDKAPEDKVETAADGKAGTETPVAFFQCASNISAFDATVSVSAMQFTATMASPTRTCWSTHTSAFHREI